MNQLHAGVVGVVARVIRYESLIEHARVVHVRDEPEFPEAESAGLAIAANLYRPDDFGAARRYTVAVRRDDAMQSVVIEFEQ